MRNVFARLLLSVLIPILLVSGSAFARKNGTKSNFWTKLENGEKQSLVLMGSSITMYSAWAGTDSMISKDKLAVPGQGSTDIWTKYDKVPYWPGPAFGGHMIQDTLKALFGDKVDIINAARNGNTSETAMAQFNSFIQYYGKAPDAAIIEFATADAISGLNGLQASYDNHKAFVEEIREKHPGTEIFLNIVAPPYNMYELESAPVLDREGCNKCLDSGKPRMEECKRFGSEYFAERVRMVADTYNTYLIDCWARFLAIRENDLQHYNRYLYDGHHNTTQAGAEIIIPTIIKTLKGEKDEAIEVHPFNSPMTPKQFYVGDTITITWSHNPDKLYGTPLNFYISNDDGLTWRLLNETGSIEPDTNMYSWIIPAALGGKELGSTVCKIKIKDYQEMYQSISESFVIRAGLLDDVVMDNDSVIYGVAEAKASFTGGWDSHGHCGDGNPPWEGGGCWQNDFASLGEGLKGGYRISTEDGASAEYKPTLDASGEYEVYLWWGKEKMLSSDVSVEVHHAQGTSTVSVDQTKNPGTWNFVGTFTFSKGNSGYIKISSNKSGKRVYADAARFLGYTDQMDATVLNSAAAARNQAYSFDPCRSIKLSRNGTIVRVPLGATGYIVYDVRGRVIDLVKCSAATTRTRLHSLGDASRGVRVVKFLTK